MKDEITVGDIVAEFLQAIGVTTAFGVVSVHNTPMLDAIGRRNAIRFVKARGEAGAGSMADAYSRVTGGLGVLFTSTGPGAANACGALVEARFSGAPLLHLTGQTATKNVDRERGTVHDVPDQLGMLKSVSKTAYRIRSAENVLGVLSMAAAEALTAPTGPVSIEIPIDIQRTKVVRPNNLHDFNLSLEEPQRPDAASIEELVKIAKGATIAFIGDTGAGKTTLAALITGLYPPNKGKGKLSIDNIPIEKYSRSDLGSQVAMVLQDPFLFQGSLKENLKFNQQSATDEEMINACKSIGIHDYITSLENGYDTSVSERGVNMSQGQRQLMGFARALIKNPKILILDEATSNIDSISEQKIQNALQVLFENRTSIVIAHRLSTIKLSDNIFVIKGGRIAEQGNHSTLMNLQKEYFKFTESSFQN